MSCKSICQLCPRLVLSQSVTFASGVLTVTLPEGCYNNCEKYCIVIAQPIPSAATINAPVVIKIGSGSVLYPLVRCNCKQLTACGLRTRTRYATVVETTPTGGSFRLLGKACCPQNNDLRSINGTAPTA